MELSANHRLLSALIKKLLNGLNSTLLVVLVIVEYIYIYIYIYMYIYYETPVEISPESVMFHSLVVHLLTSQYDPLHALPLKS